MRLKLTTTMLLLLVAGSFAGDNETRAYRGEIADSQCSMNVHSLTRSHQEMLKSKSMGGTSASCTQYCIKYLGGEYVFSSKNEVYRLDNAGAVQSFAGQKVKITGTLDAKTNTIHMVQIEVTDKRLF
jgi:hypothetical protein